MLLLYFVTGASGQAASYVGGELRIENVSDPVNRYALAFEGASFTSSDFAPFLVLGKVLGGASVCRSNTALHSMI